MVQKRTRSPPQIRKRAFHTRSHGITRAIREFHAKTDARAAVVVIYNGQPLYFDETGVLGRFGITNQTPDGSRMIELASAESMSLAESGPSSTAPSSPDLSTSGGPSELAHIAAEPLALFEQGSWNELDLFGSDCSPTTSTRASHQRKEMTRDRESSGIASLDMDFFGLDKLNSM